MGLHETVKQVLRTHEAMIASADRNEEVADRMERHGGAVVALVAFRVLSSS